MHWTSAVGNALQWLNVAVVCSSSVYSHPRDTTSLNSASKTSAFIILHFTTIYGSPPPCRVACPTSECVLSSAYRLYAKMYLSSLLQVSFTLCLSETAFIQVLHRPQASSSPLSGIPVPPSL